MKQEKSVPQKKTDLHSSKKLDYILHYNISRQGNFVEMTPLMTD